MNDSSREKMRNLGKTIFVYIGSAWVFIEVLNFLINKYYWDTKILDILILLVIFGLPSAIIYEWTDKKFTKKTIMLHSLNGVIALAVIGYNFISPDTLNPSRLRLIKYKSNKQKLAESIRSIAILPFTNLLGDKNQEYIVEGLHSALINELSKISAVRVISETSTLRYRNTNKSIQEIAHELNVDGLLEATVLKLEKNFEIRMNLVNAFPSEQQIWTENFTVTNDNFQILYNKMITDIARSINITLTPEEKNTLDHVQITNPDAYKAYMNGKYLSEELTPTEENLDLALDYFEQALQFDSTFAPAYAGISWIWISRLQLGFTTGNEAIPRIYSYNQKALDLDPDYPDAQYHKAIMSFQAEWDWEKSEKAFLRAIELNPNYSFAHGHYGHLLMFLQRFKEAVAQEEIALQLDPLSPHIQGLAAIVYWHKGDFEKALEITRGNKNIFAKKGIEESIAYLEGNFKLSIALLQDIYGKELTAFKGVQDEFSNNGYREAIQQLARNLEYEMPSKGIYSAIFYNRAGLIDDAIRVLKEGYKNHDPNMPYAFVLVEFKNLEADPRYREIAEKMKLPY